MAIALGLALVLAIVWTDSCKRHLWESMGPLHHFGCDCRGFRYYCRHDSGGNTFTFSYGPPEDLFEGGLPRADRSTLDAVIVEVAGPKAPTTFIAVQLGDAVHCTPPLVTASHPEGHVYQELRLPLPNNSPRYLQLFLYGKYRPYLERLLAVAKVPLDLTRAVGLHDITVPFLNCDSEPAGHIRLLVRVGAPGSAVLSTRDLIPYMADASESGDSIGGDSCCGAHPIVPGNNAPIVVFSAGGRPAIAVPDDLKPLPAPNPPALAIMPTSQPLKEENSDGRDERQVSSQPSIDAGSSTSSPTGDSGTGEA